MNETPRETLEDIDQEATECAFCQASGINEADPMDPEECEHCLGEGWI